jgi:hypothetical protein
MNKFWKIAPWLSRLILLPPTVIFSLIATRYLTHPVASAAAQGITFSSNLGLTISRIGLGGFPLACGIFVATCLLSRRRVLTGLTFVSILVGVVLIVRVAGMYADSTVAENLKLVRAEIMLLVLTGIGIALELAGRAQTRKAGV